MHKSKKQTLEQGTLILLIAAILSKIIGALFKIPLSSDFCLGDLGFGYFSAAYDLINPIILLSVSGLPVAVSKLISQYNSSDNINEANKVFIISRKIFLLAGIIVSLLALILVAIFGNSGDGVYCFIAIIPSFLFCFVASAYRGYFEGHTNMLPPAVSALIESLSKLLLGFSFAFITVKLTQNAALGGAAALLGIVVGTLLSALYLHLCYKKNVRKEAKYIINKTEDRLLKKEIIAIAFPIALYAFSGSVVGLVDSITVRAQLSSFTDEISGMYADIIKESNLLISDTDLPTVLYGIRSKAFTLYNIIPTLTAYLGVSAVPHISMSYETGDSSLLQKNCNKVLKLAAFISFPAGIGFMALNNRIMFLLFGESASSIIGGKMLILFGIATAFSGVSVVMGNVLQAVGHQNKALINVAIGVAVKLALNLILCAIPKINIYGSAISTAVCFAVIFILNIFSLSKTLGSAINIKASFLKIFLTAVLCGVSAYGVALLSKASIVTVIAIAVAVVVYILFIVVLRVFSIEEISDLPFGNMILKLFKCQKSKK